MPRPINEKCQKCSEISFRDNAAKPDCYVGINCRRKRSYYRRLDYYRKQQLARHRYNRYRGDKCALCLSKENLETHHTTRQLAGGLDTRMNTLTLCHSCHRIITRYQRIISKVGY